MFRPHEYNRPAKEVLPQTDEVINRKKQASLILKKAFDEVHDLGLLTVCFDVKWNERMDSHSVSTITQEEWDHGVWIG